mgnify:CR=1 FL=1
MGEGGGGGGGGDGVGCGGAEGEGAERGEELGTLRVIADGTVAGKTATLGESVVSTFDRIDSRAARGQIGGLVTHYIGLDELTGGFHDGELVVIGARPSVGKTAIAINLAVKIAEEGQAPVLFISLEMSKEELTERMLCRQARVDGSLIRTGKMNGDIAGKLVQAGAVLSSLPIHIDDSPEQRILQIAATARRHHRPLPRVVGAGQPRAGFP